MEVSIPAGAVQLGATLRVPQQAKGAVAFSHGSGSGRHSPRNQFVAAALNQAGFGTLLVDLLTAEEDAQREARFDIHLLTGRLAAAVRFLAQEPRARGLPLGLFGASTGAASALRVAAADPAGVRAVVSRGGRPDLAGRDMLRRVKAPTLLIVGAEDRGVIELNQDALERMSCVRELVLVQRATHLFEEPGALEAVAELAAGWFARYLRAGTARAGD